MRVKTLNLKYASKLDNIVEANESFDKGVLRIAYTGKNNNNSFISKEAFQKAIQSIYNCPIVCNYNRESNEIGSHDIDVVADDNGNLSIVNITQPIGLIPESADTWFEEIEDDGGIHEYLCADALLWKRQEAYEKVKENGITAESMEITVKNGSIIDGVYHIEDFEFTAFCLLESAKPCFEGASLEVFSDTDYKKQFSKMMQEVKQMFSEKNETLMKGGDSEMDTERNDIKAGQDVSTDNSKEAFELDSNLTRYVVDAVESLTTETEYGDIPQYFFLDFDAENKIVYAQEYETWNIYGFNYSVDGDVVTVDFASKKRKKCAYVDFEEGSDGSMISIVVTPATSYAKYVAKFGEDKLCKLQEKFDEEVSKEATMETELDLLRRFKTDSENAKARAERDEVLARFEDLAGIEAFETLTDKCMDFSVEELEDKCFAIRGRQVAQQTFSAKPVAPKLPIEKVKDYADPYGGIFSEYGVVAE